MKIKLNFIVLFLAGIYFIFGFPNHGGQEKFVPKEKWIRIFNEKDLKDWTIKIKGHPLGVNYKNTFRVVDGILQVNYDQYDQFDDGFGHIFYKNPYANYKLKLQYRFTGEQLKGGADWAKRNSGVMIHCQNPETIGLNQDFPVSVEVQLLGGLNKGDRTTANVCTPGTHIYLQGEKEATHCINSVSKTFHGDQWVQLEIEVRNDEMIKHFINGDEVLAYTKPEIGGEVDADMEKWKLLEGTPLKNGYIALQSESHPVEFKDIEILELQ